MREKIQSLARENSSKFIQNRRHIHSHPELSFEEYQTQAFVIEKLKSFGLTPNPIAETGVFALIEGKNPSRKTVALRADMDALPILEENKVSYCSKNQGVMHACGHDVHTASLLGVAKIVTSLKEEFEGTIKLIFQPGEEKVPGGATLMIKEGILDNPLVNSILGQHVAPQIEVGKVGFRSGMYMASTDELYFTVKGKGGHGAIPEQLIDPVLITSHIIVSLQQIISRNCSPKQPSVLSFGRVIANGATNIIPNEVYVEGTFRALNEEWREEGLKRIKSMAEGIALAMGAICEVDIRRGYPFLFNNPALTERTKKRAEEYLGKKNVIDLDIWMAAEDFAFFSQKVDSSFYRLGTRNESRGIISGVHTPTFDIDESALEIGAGLMSYLALEELAV